VTDEAFHVIDTRILGDHGILRVEELTLDTPTGPVTRIAVRHPGAVAVVALRNDTVLLIRQYRVSIDRQLLEIPAGTRDVEGELPAETAARELEEEIGYTPGTLEHVADFFTAPGFTDEHMSLFLASDLKPVPTAPDGPEEAAAVVVPVPMSEVAALLASGAVEDAKSIVGLQWLLLQNR